MPTFCMAPCCESFRIPWMVPHIVAGPNSPEERRIIQVVPGKKPRCRAISCSSRRHPSADCSERKIAASGSSRKQAYFTAACFSRTLLSHWTQENPSGRVARGVRLRRKSSNIRYRLKYDSDISDNRNAMGKAHLHLVSLPDVKQNASESYPHTP